MSSEATAPDLGSLQDAEQKMREALGLGTRREGPAQRQSADPPRQQMHRPSGDRPSSAGGHRHRFVQDGEVPVVLVNHAAGNGSPAAAMSRGTDIRSPATRVAAMAADVGAERSARERAERALQQAQASIRDLETKLAHAEIARTEAIAAARSDRAALVTARAEWAAEAERLGNELAGERAARETAEHRLMMGTQAAPAEARVKRAYTPRKRYPVVDAVEPEFDATDVPEQAPPQRKPRVVTEKPVRAKRTVAEPKPVKWWLKNKAAAR